jgi:hypothetical protein
MKQWLKRLAFALAPRTATAIMSIRSRAYSHQLVREWGLLNLNRKLIDRLGPRVQSGPFEGMLLSPMSHKEHLGPYLLGTYEMDLHPWWKTILDSRFTQVLDIGAKFGYYAVGLARRMPTTPVIAFDTDWWARKATREMAAVNSTPGVVVEGYCSSNWLNRHLLPGSFLLSDCEGFEGELFQRATTPTLDSTTLLIEIHDNLVPGVGEAVRGRFAGTHVVASVKTGKRVVPTSDLDFLTPEEVSSATREVRGPQEWLLFTPKVR